LAGSSTPLTAGVSAALWGFSHGASFAESTELHNLPWNNIALTTKTFLIKDSTLLWVAT